jgi:glycosyltransferase involved in cell wall biosynthesis
MTTRKISVIIPTYNREKLIVNSLGSVLNQTYSNIEILIIDDGSTDNTKKEIDKIKDKRIKYIKLNKNSGSCNARNIGIKMAIGTYISFQDSDDIFHPDKLKKQFRNLIKNKSDFDFCKILIVINNTNKYVFPDDITETKIYNGNIFDELLNKGNFISTQSILVKKHYIQKYLFDIKRNLKVSYTNEILVDLFVQNNSISSSKKKLKKAIQILLNKNYNLNAFQKENFSNYLNYFKKQSDI